MIGTTITNRAADTDKIAPPILKRKTMELPPYQTNLRTESSTILQKIVKADKTAVKGCIDTYGNLVWALARKYTDSLSEAEAATEEIFLDIWRYAGRCDSANFDETFFIFLIARRRLIKRRR